MKTYAKVVFVDYKVRKKLPRKVGKVLNAVDGSLPLLVFLSPDGETNYGSFHHSTLKSQDYGKIFRDLKKKVREAKKTGELSSSGVVAEEKDESEGSDGEAVVITSPRLRSWKSSKGREIQAKLIKYENGIYQLKTSKGKTISVTSADLDEETVKMADEIINVNTK